MAVTDWAVDGLQFDTNDNTGLRDTRIKRIAISGVGIDGQANFNHGLNVTGGVRIIRAWGYLESGGFREFLPSPELRLRTTSLVVALNHRAVGAPSVSQNYTGWTGYVYLLYHPIPD